MKFLRISSLSKAKYLIPVTAILATFVLFLSNTKSEISKSASQQIFLQNNQQNNQQLAATSTATLNGPGSVGTAAAANSIPPPSPANAIPNQAAQLPINNAAPQKTNAKNGPRQLQNTTDLENFIKAISARTDWVFKQGKNNQVQVIAVLNKNIPETLATMQRYLRKDRLKIEAQQLTYVDPDWNIKVSALFNLSDQNCLVQASLINEPVVVTKPALISSPNATATATTTTAAAAAASNPNTIPNAVNRLDPKANPSHSSGLHSKVTNSPAPKATTTTDKPIAP